MKNLWFYHNESNIAIKHRKAYEQSLISKTSVKVHSGTYYYRGYEINFSAERGRDYRWAFMSVDSSLCDAEFMRTKSLCIKAIDALIER
jgi:hypothetical protein